MRPALLGVTWYRFRATFRQRRSAYVSLVLLIGLVGGIAMGSLAAARRTQGSFTTFLASTNPPDLGITIYGANANNASSNPNYSPQLTRKIAHLPSVRHVEAGILLTAAPLRPDGAPRVNSTALAYPIASVNGLFFDQDRVAVTAGRMADPNRPDEIMMTPLAARQLGYHVGETIPYGIYSQAQQEEPEFGTARVTPTITFKAKLVGLATLSSEIVEDDIDQIPTFIVLTPALTREVLARPMQQFSTAETFAIQTDDGSRDVPAVESEVAKLIPPGVITTVHATAPVVAKADRAIKPIAIALGVFGGIALLATLLIAGQAISRRVRAGTDDLTVLRSLGADPLTAVADGMMGILGAIVLGTLLAVAVAVALSPLSPLGPVRPVYPFRGVSADWTVLGLSVLILVGGLGANAVVLAYRASPHRVVRRSRLVVPTRSRVTAAAVTAGLPASGVVGVRMALESGSGRTAVPVRSALLGTSLAVILAVATVVFGSSLQTLVTHPPLYGWNWTYMLSQVGSGGGNVPPQAFALLARDHDVAAYTGVTYVNADIEGQNVPFLIGEVRAKVTPAMLSGHAVENKHQIVLGAATMAQLHKRLGDSVVVSYGTPKDAPIYVPPTHVTIVGSTTMPAVGFASIISDHTSMGTGAFIAKGLLPSAFQQAMNSPDPTLNGPNLALVQMRSDVSSSAGRADLQRIARAANKAFAEVPNGGGAGDTITVVGVQRPAEIVNYRTIGFTPLLLVAGLGLGAVTALALTLAASVRRRRHDLALLKTLGFTQRQLAAAVSWQASVAATVGIIIGVPVGIILGRWLWVLFARLIYAVPEPTVPVVSVVLIALGTLVLANVVAALPARSAARTPTALMLRAE